LIDPCGIVDRVIEIARAGNAANTATSRRHGIASTPACNGIEVIWSAFWNKPAYFRDLLLAPSGDPPKLSK